MNKFVCGGLGKLRNCHKFNFLRLIIQFQDPHFFMNMMHLNKNFFMNIMHLNKNKKTRFFNNFFNNNIFGMSEYKIEFKISNN